MKNLKLSKWNENKFDVKILPYDIIAFLPKSFCQKFISFFSGLFCHVGFIEYGYNLKNLLQKIDFPEKLLPQSDKIYVISASIKYRGVFFEDFNSIKNKYGGYYIFRVRNITDLERHLLRIYAITSIGKFYDVFQLGRIFLNLLFRIGITISFRKEFGGLICSEFVSIPLSFILGLEFEKKLKYNTPDDVVTHEKIDFLKEGVF